MFSSCIVEEETSVDCVIRNESEYNIVITRYGGYDNNFINSDSLSINIGEEKVLLYSEKGMPCFPFCGTDSMVFKSNNVILKTYTYLSSGKSPLNEDYYQGGKEDYKNHITTYKYTYIIKTIDFQ
jgi:hypothetical protein